MNEALVPGPVNSASSEPSKQTNYNSSGRTSVFALACALFSQLVLDLKADIT